MRPAGFPDQRRIAPDDRLFGKGAGVRLRFYRVLGRGRQVGPEWHHAMACHLDRECARKHARRISDVVLQRFPAALIPAWRMCSWCCGTFKKSYGIYGVDVERREKLQADWAALFTPEYEIIMQACDRAGREK